MKISDTEKCWELNIKGNRLVAQSRTFFISEGTRHWEGEIELSREYKARIIARKKRLEISFID
jgi:hypothetical protein